MGSGFEIRTESDNVLRVGDDFFNLALFTKIPLASFKSIDRNIYGNKWVYRDGLILQYEVTLPSASHTIIVAVTANNKGIAFLNLKQSGASAVITVYVPPNTNLSGLESYVFIDKLKSGKSYGKQVFNSISGECMFDSNLKYMKVHSVIPKNGSVSIGATNKKLAIAQSLMSYRLWFYGRWMPWPPETIWETAGILRQWQEDIGYFAYENGVISHKSFISQWHESIETDLYGEAVGKFTGNYTKNWSPPMSLVLDVTNY